LITEVCGRTEDAARGLRSAVMPDEFVAKLLRLVPRIEAGLSHRPPHSEKSLSI
jgi:hypothetical protein